MHHNLTRFLGPTTHPDMTGAIPAINLHSQLTAKLQTQHASPYIRNMFCQECFSEKKKTVLQIVFPNLSLSSYLVFFFVIEAFLYFIIRGDLVR